MGFGHEKLDMYRACRLGLPIMKTRRSTQQGSIPIPIPTPMENMNRRIANHGLEATPKGAPQAHDVRRQSCPDGVRP
jgi:hypothetical protein